MPDLTPTQRGWHAYDSCLEAARASARKTKQDSQVREGLIVGRVDSFEYDREVLGETVEEPGRRAQLTVGVVVHGRVAVPNR